MNKFLLFLGIAIGLLAIIFDSVISYKFLHNVSDLTQHRDVALDEISGIETFLSELKDAETGERGYTITGKSQYLEPYNTAVVYLHSPTTQQFLEKEEEDPEVGGKIKQIIILSTEKLIELQDVIESRKNQGFDQAQKIIDHDAGKKEMDRIRLLVDSVVKEKRELAQQEDLEILNDYSWLSKLILLANIISFLLIGTCLYFLYWGSKRLQKDESELAILYHLTDAILDSPLPVAIRLDAEKKVLSMNKEGEKVLGYISSNLQKKPASELFDDLETQNHLEILSRKYGIAFKDPIDFLIYVAKNKLGRTVWPLKDKKGNKVPMLLALNPKLSNEGKPIEYLLEGAEITNSKTK